ncbi:MAG: amino acid-binding protein [Actinomycetota bacterium]|nr:amino acid-binding protein [Actinomycetota bacterium]
MATNMKVFLENRPGTIAEAGEAFGAAGVNIEGSCGFPCEGRGVLHFLVNDAVAARQALMAAGIEVAEERDVIVADIEDKPGALGELARRMADAGVNVDLLYLASNTRVVLGCDDPDKGRGLI